MPDSQRRDGLMLRRFLPLALLVLFALIPAATRADDILEEGPGYWVAAMYPNAGGTVILKVDYSASPNYIVTTLIDVAPAPGWTYQVVDSGGVNGQVDIRYESARYKSRFTVLYKPGKTVIDYGEIKKR